LADVAERSIDVQYYIYAADDVGAFVLERLVAAADRGVHVRMLLDDLGLALDDRALALIDGHPNIEVRIFNPFPDRSRWLRPLQLITRGELGRRMHNKVFAVDAQAVVVGGRNVGNSYFEAQAEANFRDFDLLAAGPIVKEVSQQFDEYWNSALAVPVSALDAPAAGQTLPEFIDRMRRRSSTDINPREEYERRKAEFLRRVLEPDAESMWAAGKSVADRPVRQLPEEAKTPSAVSRTIALERQKVASEMVMQIAYLVPGDRGIQIYSDLIRRGVRVRIMTNSLASTDVVAVHAGYARYRPALLAAGVELYEYRVEARRPAQVERIGFGRSDSALHAKVVVFDRRMVWMGSANFDPRSRRLNTEHGLLVESEALAERVLSRIERDFSAENSWRLTLEPDAQTGQKHIVWNGLRDGEPVRLEREEGGGLRHIGVIFFSLLPGIEDLL
jgi:putative cardiolipin synthase